MLNRASHPLHPPAPHGGTPAWDMDENPELRLGVFYVALCLALIAVAGRLTYVQTFLTGDYALDFDKTTEKFESIPSRDARILTADGLVLAEDVEVFAVKVHYRWLEEPADPAWLKQQALSRLERGARRKPERVRAAAEALLAGRNAFWTRLAGLTGTSAQELTRRRRDIQKRVERMLKTTEEQQTERMAMREVSPISGPGDHWWEQAWHTLKTTLTTPPEREAREPLVIQEQLDYHLILPEVTREVAAEIEAHSKLYPGLRIELSTRRVYPQGPLAAHLVGYRLPIDEQELKRRRAEFPKGDPLDYRQGDRIGRTGLEQYYEPYLRGRRGERRLVLNRRGEVICTEVTRAPRDGLNLELTLNVPLQRAAEKLLDEALQAPADDETTGQPAVIPRGGSLVAIDVRTGAVLAAASGPGFDLARYAGGDQATLDRLQVDQRSPLFCRVTEARLPPGSVFKVLSAVAFLQSGKLNPDRELFCQGFLDDPDHYRCYTYRRAGVGHSDVSLVDALARSCNVYFFAAAKRIRPTPIPDWAKRFGFGQPTGIDLPNEKGGNLPAAGRLDATMQLAIGQGELTVTPLQVTRMMAAIANGGRLVTPHLVESARPSMSTEETLPPGGRDEAISVPDAQPIPELTAHTLKWVREGLRQVVANPHGTGYKTVRLKEVAIAGKTGTAEPGGKRPDHAWFAGYVPVDQPRIAFVVILEHAGAGGHAAGPVARKFVQAMLHEGLLGGTTVTQREEP